MSYSASAFAFAFGCDGTFTFASLPQLYFCFFICCCILVLGAAAGVFDYASVLAAVFASACDALAFAVAAAFA